MTLNTKLGVAHFDCDVFDGPEEFEVTHWMPLPTPIKEHKKEYHPYETGKFIILNEKAKEEFHNL